VANIITLPMISNNHDAQQMTPVKYNSKLISQSALSRPHPHKNNSKPKLPDKKCLASSGYRTLVHQVRRLEGSIESLELVAPHAKNVE
jgi:hypothetical protein